MRTFTILFQKELRESWRNFKFLWMPLLFVFLGVTEPLTNYYMEDILNAVGNVPEGFSLLLPELQPADLLVAATGQFQLIGLVALVVVAAGMISGEREDGTATLIYARPISFAGLFLSKWAVVSLLGITSAVLGYIGTMYYTAVLYGTVDVLAFIQMITTYSIWILFVTAISLLFSAMFRKAVAVTLSIIALPGVVFIDSLIGQYWHVSPWKMANYGLEFLTGSPEYYGETLFLTIILIILAIIIGILFTQKNAATTKI